MEHASGNRSRIGAGLVAVGLLLGGCAMEQASPQEVAAAEASLHSWGTYHWARTANPFTLKLVDFVTPSWDEYLALASTDWSASSVLDTTIVQPSTAPTLSTRKQCKAISGQIKVCNAAYGFNGWLGIAQISVSGGHITQGTAKMNDSYYESTMYSYNTPESRRMVMCQEVAHDFGLGHQDEDHYNVNVGSCMDYTKRPEGGVGTAQDGTTPFDYGPANIAPNAHDFEQLEIIYAIDTDPTTPGHADTKTTVKQDVGHGAGAGEQIDTGSGSEDVGEPVHHDDLGRPDTFVKHNGSDTLLLTHVYWAD